MAFTRLPDRRDELLKQMLQLRARSQARREGGATLEDFAPPEEDYGPQLAPEDLAAPVEEPEEPKEGGGVGGPTNRGPTIPDRGMITEGLGSPQQPMARYSSQKIDSYSGGNAFVQGMMKRGWTLEEAAGTAGNAHVESGFRPGIKSSVPGEQSFGFLQWNKERLAGLKNMAKETGRDWWDPETQMDWIHMERTGKSVSYGGGDERSAYRKAFAGGGTPEQIAERFGRFVERPKDLSQSVDIRRRAAAQYAAPARRVGMTSEGGMSSLGDEVPWARRTS